MMGERHVLQRSIPTRFPSHPQRQRCSRHAIALVGVFLCKNVTFTPGMIRLLSKIDRVCYTMFEAGEMCLRYVSSRLTGVLIRIGHML
jgi:hypothetical protein